MSNSENLYRNLYILLKMFKNRPYHLAKYLIDNNALTKDFLEKVQASGKLKEISDGEQKLLPAHLSDITKMEEFFTSFLDGITKDKSVEEVTKDLNQKLNDCIKNEKYEDAARIRDYMNRNGIERLNN